MRTPGGTTSMPATQLPHIRRQSGAVGQVRTRLAAAVSLSGTSTAAPTAASDLVEDGAMSTASFKGVPENRVFNEQASVSEHSIHSPMETSDISQNILNEHVPSTVAPQVITTLPFPTLGHSDSDINIQSPEPDSSHREPVTQTLLIENQLAVNTCEGQKPVYLLVSKEGGEGKTLFELTLKDGKMVWSALPGYTDTPLIKLLNTARLTGEASASRKQLAPKYQHMFNVACSYIENSSSEAFYNTTLTLNLKTGTTKFEQLAGPRTPEDQPAAETANLNQAGRLTDSDSVSCTSSVEASSMYRVHTQPQTSKIVTWKVKRLGGSLPPVVRTSLGLPTDNVGTEVGHVLTPVVSQLKGVLARMTASCHHQQIQESIRYVHSESSTARILRTGTHGPNMPYDNHATALTSKHCLSKELDTTKYMPHGRSTAQRGGRGRASRGRGRATVGTSEAEPVVSSVSSSQMSTLSDFQQIGTRIIKDECEAVDGMPVVSTLGLSPEIDPQTITPESYDDPASHDTRICGVPQHVLDGLNVCGVASSAQSSQFNAQEKFSVKTNHSFKFLTQGIQGSPDTTRQPSLMLRQSHSGHFKSDNSTPSSTATSASETVNMPLLELSDTDTVTQMQHAKPEPFESCIAGPAVVAVEVGDGLIPSYVIPKKVNRFRGRTRTGSSRQDIKRKIGKPGTAKSVDINNVGSHNSSPVTEYAVKSLGCVLNEKLPHLSATQNTSVPCSGPSDESIGETLVMDSAVSPDLISGCGLARKFEISVTPTLHSNENLSNMPAKIFLNVHRKRVASPLARKNIKKTAKREEKVEKVETSFTAICNKRKKADSGAKSGCGNGTDPHASLSAASSTRHASLDQKNNHSASPSYSQSVHSPPEKSPVSWVPSFAVVRCRRLQTQEIGSTKEVNPLSLNRQLHPECARGSVGKDSVSKNALTGAAVRPRKARADWSCSADPVKA